MTYAHRPDIYDADTHMMERPDWIASFADPEIRPMLEPFVQGKPESLDHIADALNQLERRKADGALALAVDQDFMAMRHKGWHGLGAIDAEERRHANDLLGPFGLSDQRLQSGDCS